MAFSFFMQIKQATTFDQQIALLQSRGMEITDIAKAREVLADIGYYRLGFYFFPFEVQYPHRHNRTHIFREGTSFNNVLALYYFDNDLRQILTQYLHRVEVHFRTTIIYTVSNHYKDNPTWFSDSRIVSQDFIDKLPGVYSDIRKNDVIKHHHHKYHNDIYAPAWKTIEFMTFGNILYLYDNLRSNDLKEKIANQMGLRNVRVFSSHMQTLRVLRNICAHGHNIFDLHLSKSINPGPIIIPAPHRNSLSGAMMVLAFTLEHISSNRKMDFINSVNCLLDSVENTPITTIISHISKLTP